MDVKTTKANKFQGDLELESQFEDLPPTDFLYNRKGPWPQPSPNHPFGEAPGVVHIPFVEWLYWWAMIGSRYVFYWIFMAPFAFFKSLFFKRISPVTDEEFNDFFFYSCYAKFLNPNISDEHKNLFHSYIDEKHNYYIVDFVGMKVLDPISNCFCEVSRILFEKTESKINVKAINLRDYIVDESNGDLWMLAKFIALQGAANHIVLSTHPRLHFPMDTINAITKTAVPKEHILFKLLYPHFEFTLKLDSQVLNSSLSVLINKWWMIYAPFPASAQSIRDLVVLGYYGIKNNTSYPKYTYPTFGPQSVVGEYGLFHDMYYKVYFDFVKSILKEVPRHDRFVSRWADYIHNELPSFPNSKEIWEGDTFYHVVASYLWDVTLGHACDHKTYAQIPIDKNPLRVRVASPGFKNPNFKLNLNEIVSVIDQTKLYLGNWMFFRPSNVSTMLDCYYGFNLPVLNQAVKKFHEDLFDLENQLPVKKFMTVSEIPASIQY